MTAWGLAWRTIARSPARSVLAVAGVTVIGALLFNMLLLSRGLLVSFRDLLDTAGFDIRVIAAQGSMVHRLPIADATSLARPSRRLPGVANVRDGPHGLRTGEHLRRDGCMDANRVDRHDRLDRWRLDDYERRAAAARPADGRAACRCQFLAGVAASPRAGIAAAPPPVERRVRFRPPAQSTLHVVGIGGFAFEAAGDLNVATTLEGFAAGAWDAGGSPGRDGARRVATGHRGVHARRDHALRSDVRVLSNDQVLEQFNENAFSYFRQISAVLSSMTLAFAFLLIATLLTMSVNQRLGEVAALRALGFPRRRIAANLLWESALLVGVGGIAALPVGGLLAVILDRILRQMPGVPARLHFFVFEPRTVVLHAALLCVTGALAAVYPIWLATRLPIAATLRREILS